MRRKFLSVPGFEFTQTSSDIGYLELLINPNEDGDFFLDPKFLVWPASKFMMNAIPNVNKTFTGNIVMPLKGVGATFDALKDKKKMKAFLEENFPTVIPFLNMDEIDVKNTEILKEIKCFPWSINKVCLIGDAAHSMYPFYGQGLNCGLEDC